MNSGALFGRRYRILVTDANDQDALDVSELECTFEVHKSYDRGGFYAVVRIFNLEARTEKTIINEGDRLIIEAGYQATVSVDKTAKDEDGNDVKYSQDNVAVQYGKIFDGKITWPSRQREGVNYVLTLAAIDGDYPLHSGFISKTVGRGLNARDIIHTVCKTADVSIPINSVSDGLSLQKLPRGKVMFGQPMDYIRDVARGNDASYFVEDGALHVTRLQDTAKEEALVVTPETGLIGTPTQTQDGVNFTLLLNPNIHLGTLIQLKGITTINEVQNGSDSQSVLDEEWIYQAIGLVHRGDTRGNDWYTEITGVSRYGKEALPAILQNSAQNAQGV